MQTRYFKKGLLLIEGATEEEMEEFADEMVEQIRVGYEKEQRERKERRRHAKTEDGSNPHKYL